MTSEQKQEKIERVARSRFPLDDVLYSGLRAAFMDGARYVMKHAVMIWRELENDPPEKVNTLGVFMKANGYARVSVYGALNDHDEYKWWFPLTNRPREIQTNTEEQ